MFENIFETVNAGLAQALYEDFLKDPSSVPPAWRELFENGLIGEEPLPEPARDVAADESSDLPGDLIKGPALRLLDNMEASLTIPTATSIRDIGVETIWNQRKHVNTQLQEKGLKLSFTHIIGWALVQAAREYPSMIQAVLVQDGAKYRVTPSGINLGLAVDVERKDGSRGLMVPVIKGTGTMSFADFHTEYERVVAGARGGKLLPDSYMGATMTLTNPGTIGTVASVPRLMVGQGSIIATGAIRTIAGTRVMTLTSTYDHRIIQGAESGMFLQHVDRLLQGENNFYGVIASDMGVTVAPMEGTIATLPARPAGAAHALAHTGSTSREMLYHVAAAMSLVKAHRTHGYLAASLDPLGTPPVGDPALDPEPLGLTPDIQAQIPSDVLRVYVGGATLAEALPALQETYRGAIAYEIEHIANHGERVWLRRVIESGDHRAPLATEQRRALLESLINVEGLEVFLHRSYLGHKRFGIEGLDTFIPMLDAAIQAAAGHGAEEIVIGMAHRGRLNVLAHILGVSYEKLLAEFEGGRKVEETLAPQGGTGDVKYHHGAQRETATIGHGTITVTLLPNPSHLEAVNPVVEGYARAVQTARDTRVSLHNSDRCLPILVHGDAAFAGQGIVAETFNLTNLAGYDTGGTLHLITNNQIGFTTDPMESRSTDFASDLAKGFDVPIIHVNADRPELCISAVRLAMMYREQYGKDCVIDLVGYRRHGHNEGDEPRYTQPEMYRKIDMHPSVRSQYADRLTAEGVVTAAEVDALVEQHYQGLVRIQQALQDDVAQLDAGEEPIRTGPAVSSEPVTAVARNILEDLNEKLLQFPDGFTPNAKLKRQLDRRLHAFGEEAAIDWGHGEALALSSLLVDGFPIRMSGQDIERGTFSHRHLVLHDTNTGATYSPIAHLSNATAPFELHNSPLSEYGVLGFEYGYSVRAPTALVIWEAQFGDFVNGAQIIIDQFISAGQAKWGQTARLVMLLPHGSEGQGPEHSSARIERFLAIAAEGNIRVANCSTPAQYFHLLRRQAMHHERRPLVIATPKSLLRLPQASAAIGELTDGGFHGVLDDPTLAGTAEDVTRIVMCSGKVFYDITADTRRADAKHVAVGRIEMLYPFPDTDVADLIASYRNVTEIVWVQEESSNYGARKWAVPKITEAAGDIPVRYVSRPERSSPAEGYPAAYRQEQHRIVSQALAST